MKQRLFFYTVGLSLFLHLIPVYAERLTLETLASGLGVPWGMTFISQDKLLFTEREGSVGLLDLATGEVSEIAGAPAVVAIGQGGLLDVQKSPHYSEDRWLYFTYSKPERGGSATALARSKLSGTTLIDWETLFVSNLVVDSGYHFGSRICFDQHGHLFLTHGERGQRNTAQDLGIHGGSILRLNLDGSVPSDNPFVEKAFVKPEIWSYGHRNPQGIACDNEQQRLWVIEHGPRGGDELNLVEAGKNYGWPVISHGKEYTLPIMVGEGSQKPGMEQPRKVYIPSIAPSSLLLYSGRAFPEWRGNLFAGALKLTHLNRLVIDDAGNVVAEERLLESQKERIRHVIQGPHGELVISTDSGKIIRVMPAAD